MQVKSQNLLYCCSLENEAQSSFVFCAPCRSQVDFFFGFGFPAVFCQNFVLCSVLCAVAWPGLLLCFYFFFTPLAEKAAKTKTEISTLTGNPIQFPMAGAGAPAAPGVLSVCVCECVFVGAGKRWELGSRGFFPQPVFGVGVALGFLTWPDPRPGLTDWLTAFCIFVGRVLEPGTGTGTGTGTSMADSSKALGSLLFSFFYSTLFCFLLGSTQKKDTS